MNERETKKLATPSGKEVHIKTYITARERNVLRSILLEGMSYDTAEGKPITKMEGAMVEKAEMKVLETLVTFFDGSKEKVLDRILDGSPQDYDFIYAEANKVANLGQAK